MIYVSADGLGNLYSIGEAQRFSGSSPFLVADTFPLKVIRIDGKDPGDSYKHILFVFESLVDF